MVLIEWVKDWLKRYFANNLWSSSLSYSIILFEFTLLDSLLCNAYLGHIYIPLPLCSAGGGSG